MSQLNALLGLWCPGPEDYEPSQEELERQRRDLEARLERERRSMFGPDQFARMARVEGESGAIGVKILRDKNNSIHWMDTKVWPFHFPYCVKFLGETRTLQEFNEQVYTGKDRSMMFATVVGYPIANNKKCMCLELNPADPMNDLKALNGFFEEVKNCFHYGENELYFHPTSAVQMAAIKNQTLRLPVIGSDALFGNLKYKLVVPGEFRSKRVCVFEKKDYTEEDLNKWVWERTSDEIIVVPSVPNDIPVVGAVICGEIIPPLCHVALLCQNRKTPCCFVQDCVESISKRFTGGERPIIAGGVILRSGYFVEDDGSWTPTHLASLSLTSMPKPDTSVTQLIDIHEDKNLAINGSVVGAKAAQLAKVEAAYSQPLFKGTFVVPFHHYEKHVYNNAAVAEVITKNTGNRSNNVQKAICRQPVDAELVKSVIEKIKLSNMTSVIFRSSTNAEDLKGFNGAGLYESVPLKGDDAIDPQKVGAAIQKVWASVWSTKAMAERQHYKIVDRNVAMAILVMPFIDKQSPGVKVHYNGVCITHDVAHHRVKHGFVVDSYPGTELRVTNHYKSMTPEHAVLALGRETKSIDVLIVNTATGHPEPLVTQHDAEKMVQVFGKLHSTMLYKPHKLDDTVALDIEFMVVDNEHSKDQREIVVLQARPYSVNVVHQEDLDALEAKLEQIATSYQGTWRRVTFYWSMSV